MATTKRQKDLMNSLGISKADKRMMEVGRKNEKKNESWRALPTRDDSLTVQAVSRRNQKTAQPGIPETLRNTLNKYHPGGGLTASEQKALGAKVLAKKKAK